MNNITLTFPLELEKWKWNRIETHLSLLKKKQCFIKFLCKAIKIFGEHCIPYVYAAFTVVEVYCGKLTNLILHLCGFQTEKELFWLEKKLAEVGKRCNMQVRSFSPRDKVEKSGFQF